MRRDARDSSMVRWMLMLVVTCSVMLSVGCSSFERDWEKSVTSFRAPHGSVIDADSGVAGPWTGTWLSNANGHGGNLRCIMTHQEGDQWLAEFHSTYGDLLAFEYDAVMTVTPGEGATYTFTGSEDLGLLAGGVYEYSGRVEGDTLTCDYKAEKDHGVFEMKRPPLQSQ